MPTKTYSPADVQVSIAGNPLQMFADGTFINITPDEDLFTKVTGADGITSRSKSSNRSFRVEVTLQQTSPSNDILSNYAALDEISNGGVFPIQIKDNLGRTLFSAPEAWVARFPDQEFSKEISNRGWMIDTGRADVFIGGN